MPHLPLRKIVPVAVSMLSVLAASAAEHAEVFSGPQPGEKTTAFQVLELKGPRAGSERNITEELDGAPATFVFVHGIERSMAPLMSAIDEYGDRIKDKLKTEFVFLSGDRLSSQQRLPVVARALRLKSPISLSTDGPEGPGNYGLNKHCLLTVLVAKDNKVTANFALVQPGIADAQRILQAMAEAAGDPNPPQASELQSARHAMRGGEENRRMEARRRARGERSDSLPGAAPTDEQLVTLLREFIQKGNDEARVDKVLKEVETYVAGKPDLERQAVDGWTRVLHLKYGTEYAQKQGAEFVKKLSKE